jgi:hypothetical protein
VMYIEFLNNIQGFEGSIHATKCPGPCLIDDRLVRVHRGCFIQTT